MKISKLLLLLSCIITSPLYAMESTSISLAEMPKAYEEDFDLIELDLEQGKPIKDVMISKSISLAEMDKIYKEDFAAIELDLEQGKPIKDAIQLRSQKYTTYGIPHTQGTQTTLKRVAPPEWAWLNIATEQGKEKIIEPLMGYIKERYECPMDYALKQENLSLISTLFRHEMIKSDILRPDGLFSCSKESISDTTMVYYLTKLNELKKCPQEYLASAAANIIECCSDETIRKCFFQGLLNPALSEGATPISLRMGKYIQEKLAIALEKTIDPEVKKQSWNALPEKLALFRDKASKGEFQGDEEAEQYYDLLHNLYFFMKARSEFSNRGGCEPQMLPISESMANDIKEIIRTHKSLNGSKHTFLCAAAILRYLRLSNVNKTDVLDNDLKKDLLVLSDTFLPLCFHVLPSDKVKSCLSLVQVRPKQKIKND